MSNVQLIPVHSALDGPRGSFFSVTARLCGSDAPKKIARSRSRDRHDRRALLACSGRIRHISGCLWRWRWGGEPKCTKRHRGSEFVANSEAARYVFVVVVIGDVMDRGRRYGTFVLACRPVTTPNLHFAPPFAKPADHTRTRHTKTGVCSTPHKKEEARRALKRHIADKDPSPQRERRASDVRAESRRVHWAWRGCGSPVPLEHEAGWGRVCFRRSRAGTAPFRVAITTALFAESRLFYACFFCAMLRVRGSWAAGGLRCVAWPRGQWAWRQTRRLIEDGDGVHHTYPFYDDSHLHLRPPR